MNEIQKQSFNNLIIGSSGFVGKYLCNYLRKRGENVVEYDIQRNEKEDCRYGKLPLENINRVYFLGWKVGGSKYLYDKNTQKEQLDWNIKILMNTLDQLIGIPFVFVSSQLAENNNLIYGVLKRLGELWTELNGGNFVRLWNVYGSFEESSKTSHVISDFIHQALNKCEIKMISNGYEMRQFIHVEDVCNGLHEIFNHKKKNIYNITSGSWISIKEIAQIISNETGCSIDTKVKYSKKSKHQNYYAHIYKESDLLVPNWQPKITLEDGIKKTIKLFKEQIK